KNYLAGRLSEVGDHHDFAVFDFSGLGTPIASAQLQLFNPSGTPTNPSGGFSSFKPSETYTLFDVSTPIAALRASNTGRTDIFTDLGSGVAYGSQVVSAADNNT